MATLRSEHLGGFSEINERTCFQTSMSVFYDPFRFYRAGYSFHPIVEVGQNRLIVVLAPAREFDHLTVVGMEYILNRLTITGEGCRVPWYDLHSIRCFGFTRRAHSPILLGRQR